MKTPQNNPPDPSNPPRARRRAQRGNGWTQVRVPGSDQGSPVRPRPAPASLAPPGPVPAPEDEDELSAYRQTTGG